jgi:hypothetical protein
MDPKLLDATAKMPRPWTALGRTSIASSRFEHCFVIPRLFLKAAHTWI